MEDLKAVGREEIKNVQVVRLYNMDGMETRLTLTVSHLVCTSMIIVFYPMTAAKSHEIHIVCLKEREQKKWACFKKVKNYKLVVKFKTLPRIASCLNFLEKCEDWRQLHTNVSHGYLTDIFDGLARQDTSSLQGRILLPF